MHSVSQKCRPKHQVLVLKCYPRFQKGVQQVKPNSSELSYLLYYASTRRSKLPKVGAFLEKRAARDVWRGKIGNVQVTLQILAALIEKLPRDLPLYARCVLTILETVLRSHEISMVEETLPTFEAFCHHQDMAVLAADRDYLSQYRDIVRFYANLASPDQKPHSKTPLSTPILVRWRNAGLQAVKSVVSSEALTTDGAKQLGIVIPVVLRNLYCNGNVPLSPLQEEASNSEKHEQELARRRRMSIATVQTVDTVEGGPAFVSGSTADADKIAEAEVRVLALRCLEKVFVTGGNRGQIRVATSLILQYIVDNCPPWRESTEGDGTWATNLIEVVAKWAPVQDRFIILLSIMETLVNTPVVEDKLESHLILASMMDWLLASPMNLIGLSVMDILIGLLQHILSVLQLRTPSSRQSCHRASASNPENEKEAGEASAGHNPDNAVAESPAAINLQQNLVELLQRCIGDIATHVYYPDQVSDMIRTIITRLKPFTSSEGATEAPSEALNNIRNFPVHDSTKKNGLFTFPAAQISALRAVKNILVVANLRTSLAVSGSESRNKVSIQVWQGTQWLLSEPDREVRRDYIDALLSWLQLETTKDDLRVPSEPEKTTNLSVKREASAASNTFARRIMSTSRRESNAAAIACSRFLQGLHLAIYDLATESALVESDILLSHLLLANLVENLGVNAARYGLPMILRLQEDFIINQQSNSALARLNIGSLIHGYLWALTEKFDLERTRVGSDIVNEISKRKRLGVWLDKVQLPPRPINYTGSATSPSGGQDTDTLPQPDKSAYTPFGAFNGLVDLIEHTYNSTYSSPPASPPHSPGRAFSAPSFSQGHGSSSQTLREDRLPTNVREQMLSPWSKDACLAALEAEKANSSSISGSKAGTSATRNNMAVNGDKNGNVAPNDADASAQRHAQIQDPPTSAFVASAGAEGHQNARRQSNPDGLRAPATASSRDSTVKVNDLRRVLSVINNSSQVRLSSPLRGRPRVSHRSTASSSSTESMVSDTFSGSDGTNTERAVSSRPQSSQRDGSETPKASVTHQTDTDSTIHAEDFATDRDRPHGIPPVPPLPSALTIPGGFPDSTAGSSIRSLSYSPVRSEHMSPSPTQRSRQQFTNGQSNTISVPRQSRSLTRQKSRSTPRNGKPIPKQLSLSPRERRGHGYSDGAALAIGHDGETPPLSPVSPLSPIYPRDSSAATVQYRGDRRQSSGTGRIDVDKLLNGLATDGTDDIASFGTAKQLQPPTSPKFPSEHHKAGKAKLDEVTPLPAGRKREAVRFSSLGRNGASSGGIGKPPY